MNDTLNIKNQYIDDHTSVSFSEEEKRWLINFSLIQFNVLPSVVKDFKEVKENITLYLETLKKCDEYKYQYYTINLGTFNMSVTSNHLMKEGLIKVKIKTFILRLLKSIAFILLSLTLLVIAVKI